MDKVRFCYLSIYLSECWVYSIKLAMRIETVINRSIIVVLTLPHARVQHLLIVTIWVAVVHPVMDTLRLRQPLLVVLVKLTLLYTLVELDVVRLPQDSQHLVVYLPHALIGVLNQLQNPHQHFPLIEYPF